MSDVPGSVAIWRRWTALAAATALAALGLAAWCLLRSQPVAPPPPPAVQTPEAGHRLLLHPSSFHRLPGWGTDHVADALDAFLRSCSAAASRLRTAPAGRGVDWTALCADGQAAAGDEAAARRFLRRHFQPFGVTDAGHREGLFTGYYEPTLHGSRHRTPRFTIPLYRRPPELVSVELGDFRPDLAGRRIAGRVRGGRLVPFADRTAIEEGALAGRGLELAWVDDPVDAFFLQVQGSGRVELAGGGVLRVGYAAQNGHPYYAIGRELIERGELLPEQVTMQSIRAWLATHPGAAREVMRTNASYVFFQELSGEGPVGALGVLLTPGRSLAVDPTFLPLGLPLWLDATVPAPGSGDRTLRRLMIAQDTGGAIRGPVRGDVFWGPGDEAAEVAGRMKHHGRLWLLVPRSNPVPSPGVRHETP